MNIGDFVLICPKCNATCRGFCNPNDEMYWEDCFLCALIDEERIATEGYRIIKV